MGAAVVVTAAFAAVGARHVRAPRGPTIHRQVVTSGSGLVPVPASWVAKGVDPGTALGGTAAPGFALTDQFGRRTSLAAWRGKVVVLAFVDSRSTTLSPLTAQTLVDAGRLLGKGMADVQFLAVNANPVHTSVADVRTWSSEHGMLRRWLFLTGPTAVLRAVWRRYGVAVQTVGGTVQDTPSVFVIDAHGREQAVFLTSGVPGNLADEADVLARTVNRHLPHPVALKPPGALRGQKATAVTQPTAGAFVLSGLTPNGASATIRVGAGSPHLVAFFATWCHACGEDLRVLDSYERARGPHAPSVVAVDLTVAEPSAAYVRAFAMRNHVAFPVALDATGKVADAYGVTALPTLALVDASGRIRWRHTGVLPLAALQAVVRKSGV